MLTAMDDSWKKALEAVGVCVPRILLPRNGTDLKTWAVIACDQHTSEPEYWNEADRIVGEAPSTLRLIYPEVYLDEQNPSHRIARIHHTMQEYLQTVLEDLGETIILTKRSTTRVRERTGMVLALDLEHYDYRPGAHSLIRATEQTIVERIPPRVRIRTGAPLELPHVLVLIDDPANRLFSGLGSGAAQLLYDTDLMLDGGHVSGYRLSDPEHRHVAAVLPTLLSESQADPPFLFAVGDGNHSLATAKAVWDGMRATAAADHPARYALVEVVNLYDPGLRFEAIHRLVRCLDPEALVRDCAAVLEGTTEPCRTQELPAKLDGRGRGVGLITRSGSRIVDVPGGDLPVAAVQAYLDRIEDAEVDYIHGWSTVARLGSQDNTVGIVLPDFDPGLLYPTVSRRGVLPRKAFSLGEASEKRYYLEARRIS